MRVEFGYILKPHAVGRRDGLGQQTPPSPLFFAEFYLIPF
jgi:hypothetical protein